MTMQLLSGLRAGVGPVLLALLAACGGVTPTAPPPAPPPAPPAPPPPPPPPAPDVTRNASIQAGDGQRAVSGQPVTVRPAVRVVNQSGAGVAGITVSFAIGQGAGAVAGESQTTGSDGIATVGGWTLGTVGPNTLVATVTGATSGSPLTFTAIADENLVDLARDSTVNGVVRVTRFLVRAGVTLTVTDSLRVVSDSTIEVLGTIRGSCVPMTLDAGRQLVLKGTVDNSCDEPGAAPPVLTLIGRAGYELRDATVRRPGELMLTTDPALRDSDFLPAAALRAPPSADASSIVCFVGNTTIEARPRHAKHGLPALPIAFDGFSGRDFRANCGGDLTLLGDVFLIGQDGGDGGEALHQPAFGDASGTGGRGGRGGLVYVQAGGTMLLSGAVSIFGGNGGIGGRARAIAGSGQGLVAPSGRAEGGEGGEPGLFGLHARGEITIAAPGVRLITGFSGDGGEAVGEGADGADAQSATTPAQHGGVGQAFGGKGGSSRNDSLVARGVVVVNPANLQVEAAGKGHGGLAKAKGGIGGKGIHPNPDGGEGGNAQGFGGDGGDSNLYDHLGRRIGQGGWAGKAEVRAGTGGMGYDGCSDITRLRTGGNGGLGGTMNGGAGDPGTGETPGLPGSLRVDNGGSGGAGGNGFATGGNGGASGTDASFGPNITRINSFRRGSDGIGCMRVQPQSISIQYQSPVGSCVFNFSPSGLLTVLSILGVPTSFTATIVNLSGNSGMSLQVDPSSVVARGATASRNVAPQGTTQLSWFFDPCVARDGGGNFTAEIQVELKVGTSSAMVKIPVQGTPIGAP